MLYHSAEQGTVSSTAGRSLHPQFNSNTEMREGKQDDDEEKSPVRLCCTDTQAEGGWWQKQVAIFYFFFFSFETESHHVAQAGQERSIKTRLAAAHWLGLLPPTECRD